MTPRKSPPRRGETTPAAPDPTVRSGRRRRPVWRLGIPVLLATAVIVTFANKPGRDPAPAAVAQAPALASSHPDQGTTTRAAGIPRLVDVGADKCIPCKAMAPILVELRVEYAGRMLVDFIDVWKDPSAGDPYNVYAIPTQIFFDGSGRELTRHEGFISKTDILATWKRHGFDFSAAAAGAPKS